MKKTSVQPQFAIHLITRRQLVWSSVVATVLLVLARVVYRFATPGGQAGYKVLHTGDARVFKALAEAAFPGDHAAPGVDVDFAAAYFDSYLSRVGEPYYATILAGLFAIEWGVVIFGYFSRMSSLPLNERIELLERWRTGPLMTRSIMNGIKTVVSMPYWSLEHNLQGASVYYKCPNWDGPLVETNTAIPGRGQAVE